jgi:hypothetical protein
VDFSIGYFLGAQRQPQVYDGELLHLAAMKPDNFILCIFTTKDQHDGALCQVSFQTERLPKQPENLIYYPCLMHGWSDEEDNIIRV